MFKNISTITEQDYKITEMRFADNSNIINGAITTIRDFKKLDGNVGAQQGTTMIFYLTDPVKTPLKAIERMRLRGNGDAEVEGTFKSEQSLNTSDERIKRNFRPYETNIERLMQVKAYHYDLLEKYRDSTGNYVITDRVIKENDFGFKAQELYEIFPELVSKPFNEKTDLWAVDYSRMSVILTKAIQEQQMTITQQEDIIHTQQEEIESLKERMDRLEKLLEKKK